MLKELVFRTDIEKLGDYKFYEIVKCDLNQNYRINKQRRTMKNNSLIDE